MIAPNGRVILLVEDSQDDELLTLRAFKKVGILNEVVVRRDGAEAVEYLFGTKAAEPPQVILLDLNLPRIGGLEVLRRIREDARMKYVPVVVLTASKEEEDLVRSYELGANGYVRKPVAFAEFAEAVKHLGMFWLLVNQPLPRSRNSPD